MKYLIYYENGVKVAEEVSNLNERELQEEIELLKADSSVSGIRVSNKRRELNEREQWKGRNIDEDIWRDYYAKH